LPGKPVDALEYQLRFADGTSMDLPRVGRGVGRPGGVAARRRRNAPRRHRAEARPQALQEQDRRKNEFLATLAHELRNPLAPIATQSRSCDARTAASAGSERCTPSSTAR
jgi:signal transduction histidine kinase